jgi:hypothetical protein
MFNYHYAVKSFHDFEILLSLLIGSDARRKFEEAGRIYCKAGGSAKKLVSASLSILVCW